MNKVADGADTRSRLRPAVAEAGSLADRRFAKVDTVGEIRARRRRKGLLFLLILACALVPIGCADADKPAYEEGLGYKPSTVNEQFLIPVGAIQREAIFHNPNILRGAEYELADIGGEQGLYPPQRYFQDLEAAGWRERKDDRLGHVHFFERDNTVISVEIRQDSFTVYEMKDEANAAIP
ncbi:hypothetical protein [Paenibacillus arenilitoris]|uniref:Uncharacterized protein n=1 Tax=Paenibacillus arenilitoris TaxID=2772299 RepID=A0A927CJJ1_9BACL|nr:hypothetical protein [Paenibacillus arenilitoris]MBD2869263.1 hypothetical protein [Paenibacillus arenilitoris]